MGVLNFFFLLANMHVVLIIYTQHLSPPNVLSGFGRPESARWKPWAAWGRGGGAAGGAAEEAGVGAAEPIWVAPKSAPADGRDSGVREDTDPIRGPFNSFGSPRGVGKP